MTVDEIKVLLSERIRKLDELAKDHAGTKHEYPLKAGQYELYCVLSAIIEDEK